MKVYSHSLQGKRQSNEDQHIHILNSSGENSKLNAIDFLAVFDGHGGKAVSKYLKDNLPQYFINKFKKDIYSNSTEASKYFHQVFNTIQNNMIETHPRAVQYCGSTACISIIHIDEKKRNILWVLNVGDSRAIKCNKSLIAEQLTQDHKPNAPEEKRRIEKLGGKIEFDGADWRIKDLSLSRAFGDLECTPYVTHLPQIYRYKISSSDKFIVLACDGLWDVLSNQDVVDFIINLQMDESYSDNYAKDLAEYALKKGSFDNVSVIILFI
jgi:serine/threonine protein phosphatase PrpC